MEIFEYNRDQVNLTKSEVDFIPMMNREKVRVKGGVALSIEGTVFKNKDKKIPQIDIKRIQTMIKA